MKKIIPEAVQKGLKTKVLGRPTVCLQKVGSTNDLLLRMAGEGASEGTAVLAETQTKGRGRQGRKWASIPGKSLSLSILLRPRLKPAEVPEITLAAAVAVAKTLESFRLKPKIKWPNDLLLGERKVCGILTEMGREKDKMSSVVLGIGVNLNQSPAEFPVEIRGIATSFYRFSGRKIDRVRFYQRLLLDLEEAYGWVRNRRFSKVLAEWRKRSWTLGKQVKVTTGVRVFFGQAVDLDENGSLLIRNDSGIIERVVSGDVETLKLKDGPGRKMKKRAK